MARKRKRQARAIIKGYLEKVGSGVFEKYQEAITSLITGEQGVYALYRRHKLYYVGLASNLKGRIKHHLKDKHRGEWDRFSLYIIRKEEHTREVEAILVRIADPAGNTQRGKLKRSSNLLPGLKQQVKREQNKEREMLFEQYEKQMQESRTVKTQARKPRRKKDRPLKGFFPAGKVLYARYKGVDFKAWVNRQGRIRCQGKRYDSPSMAAKAILNRGAVNGWNFWKYKDDTGNFKPIRHLRN